MVLRDKIQEQEETISELENKLKERNETWQTEKKKLTSDIKLLKNEVSSLVLLFWNFIWTLYPSK